MTFVQRREYRVSERSFGSRREVLGSSVRNYSGEVSISLNSEDGAEFT